MAETPSRREKLLEAARGEFGAHGVAGARVARIAAAAGVNKQLIFYYFGSKDGLRRAVEARAAEVPGLPRSDDPSLPATERLRGAVRSTFDALADRPELLGALVRPPGIGGAGGDAERALGALEEGIAGRISEGQGLGYFRDDADPAVIGRQAVVLCAGFLALEYRLRDPDREEWVREVCETLVRVLAW